MLVRFILPSQLQRSCSHAFFAAWQAWKLRRPFFPNQNFCASKIISVFSFFLFPLGAPSIIKHSTSIVMSPVLRLHDSLVFFRYFYYESSLLKGEEASFLSSVGPLLLSFLYTCVSHTADQSSVAAPFLLPHPCTVCLTACNT